MQQTIGYKKVQDWLKADKKKPFDFQEEAWQYYADGYSGLVNAPTGFGKTFSLFLAVVMEGLSQEKSKKNAKERLQLIWITPLRSLAKDIARAMNETLQALNLDWHVGVRNGDTSQNEKLKQKKSMPEILLITPESLHLLLAQKGSSILFNNLKCIVADEWHELLGSKRGVMVELAISRIKALNKNNLLRIWGISATIGNLDEALDVIEPDLTAKRVIIRAKLSKKITIKSILPDDIETLPWAGHLGLKLAYKLLPIIKKSKTTLIFINTRGQSEMWYQHLLNIEPDLAGRLAIHHGSIDFELRNWIEESLHTGLLKAVIATSSLDLGVDFKPVDTVVQVGSPKGVARFLQRAGRSGHSPGATSKIYFLPTHALELVEAAAIKEAAKNNNIESREPMVMVFDTLIQYLVSLAVGDGFDDQQIYQEVKNTHAFKLLLPEEWSWIMQFITTGGDSLTAYQEFNKVVKDEQDGLWKVKSRQIAMRHRLHIGTIISDAMLKVKFLSGGYIGMVEEYFISKLKPNDSFTLAGRILDFVQLKDMTVIVRRSKKKRAMSPSWLGGRLPLSSNLGAVLRKKYNEVLDQHHEDEELDTVYPLFLKQQEKSHVPKENELLIELINNREGFHLFSYPFEGRLVHEILAALVAYRLSRLVPITFSIAMNDYGFELLSDTEIPMDDAIAYDIFSPVNLAQDIKLSINSTEMARRKFRDIACIAGLVFQGYPGKYVANKHLQSSAGLFFNVFSDFDKHNLLLRQAYDEVFYQQLEEPRLLAALHRIQQSNIVITHPKSFTPLSFPIKVDSLRANMSSEELDNRIERMKAEAAKF
ncbi:ligase-associated DNA damage response DEXH box helicase [Pedobacter insulae]|uniref:ATP-dependent helicase Lhr and Lhr-like helicase n=1 Tax=Pedobacter insulae TaxID=414048 RepID=A0A1I2UXG3_9SPHI|nr:ligase-associated DNA damage response DEXH box helicase [Pedobacter insulae]SFG79586.1 ATP-dependent helicase Lhr and Lhr-like helicase [Pedobacter insulae]